MAKKRTKLQKKRSDERIQVTADGMVSFAKEHNTPAKQGGELQSPSFSPVIERLLYRDLLKTLFVSVVVFLVLLSIFVYMR